MPYVCFAGIAAHETISSNEQESRPSKMGVYKEMDRGISGFLLLTLRVAICYNYPSINWDKAVCDPVTMN